MPAFGPRTRLQVPAAGTREHCVAGRHCTPCATVMEWYALEDAVGTATLTVATSTSPSGWLLPQMPAVAPYLGSFGDATKTSSRGEVTVGEGSLKIRAVIAPSKIPEGRDGYLKVRAHYHAESDSTPAADVSTSVTAHGCNVNPTAGTTDDDGIFKAMVTRLANTLSVEVTAVGVGGSSAHATAKATREPNMLLECYKEYTDPNCFQVMMAYETGDTSSDEHIRWWYNVEANLVSGTWWRNVTNVDSLTDCDFDGAVVDGFLTVPNADCNRFTYDARVPHRGPVTVTVLVSKN